MLVRRGGGGGGWSLKEGYVGRSELGERIIMIQNVGNFYFMY